MGDVDLAALLLAWLGGRSTARGLPAPVLYRGGYQVDTNGIDEIGRWVFSEVCDTLVELAHEIDAPGYVLKACVPDAVLRAVLPDRWQLQSPSFFMIGASSPDDRPLAKGYAVERLRDGAVANVRIVTREGELAASGFGAEATDAFVYDRIGTAPAHRRKGLGRAVMTALDRVRRKRTIPALLVATTEGRALYSRMGWRTIAPYATASIPAA